MLVGKKNNEIRENFIESMIQYMFQGKVEKKQRYIFALKMVNLNHYISISGSGRIKSANLRLST